MKKILIVITIASLLSSCAVSRKIKKDNIALKFLDEFVFPAEVKIGNTVVGGLSGIDYNDGSYYLVSDQSSNPRIYTGKININGNSIENVYLDQLITLKKSRAYLNEFFDLEALRFDAESELFVVASEGLISDGKDPGIYTLNNLGEVQRSYKIPEYFTAKDEQKPRNNGVFEGIAESYDGKGYWVATELPLEKDGPKPKLFPSRSHIRITKFDKTSGEPVKQFTYKLDGIAKLPINYFAVNGVTEIIEYAQDKFLILERAYSAGYGSHGNTVKIFDVDAVNATNTLDLFQLKGNNYKKAEKNLLFNFKSVKDQLTNEIVDNIEGMCFGPVLENGKQSLILVSDNNFNSFATQINQFILMQIEFKNASSVTD